MGSKNTFLTTSVAILIGAAVISIAILISGGIIKIGPKNAATNAPTPSPTDGLNQPVQAPQGPLTVSPINPNIKTFFQKKDAQVCKEDGRPIIYLFSTTWCPHCQWIDETFDKVVKEYVNAGKIKAFHWQVDTGDNSLTEIKETKVSDKDLAIYSEFNPQGSIPTFVFGCKYFRTGNGYEQQKDLAAEEAEFREAIGDLLK